MTCTKPGCRNQQCYICGESCDYTHFKKTGCPLHDPSGGIEARHRQEAETAQEAARKRVLEENPGIAEEELQIKLPDDPTPARVEHPMNIRAPIHRRPRGMMNGVIPYVRPQEWPPVPAPLGQRQEAGHTEAQMQERQYQIDMMRGRIRRVEEALRGQAGEAGEEGDLLQFGPAAPQGQGQQQQFQFGPAAPQGRAPQYQTGQVALRIQIQPPFEQAGWTIRRAPGRVLHPLAPGQRPRGWRPPPQRAAVPVPTGPEDELLPRSPATPPINSPRGLGAEVINAQHLYNTDGGAGRAGTPRTEALKNMGQRQSRYSTQLLRRMVLALQPYFDEISQQLSNHIRGSWVGILPSEIPASLANPIREQIWAGVPLLVERELEEIDRVVRDTHWEKLYEPQGEAPGQAAQGAQWQLLIRHYGRIPAPETEDEYVALHEIIRSRDRRAPPHHEELARQAHARVMVRLGQQLPPPRVAPFYHYGHPDWRLPQGQPSLSERIQAYMVKRRARELNEQVRRRAGEESKRAHRAVWGDGGKSPVQDPAAGPACATQRSVSHPSTPVRSPQAEGSEIRLLASQPAQRTWAPDSAGAGSREAPIMIDDAAADENGAGTPSRGGNALPFRAQMVVGLGGAAGGTEPPRKRGKA